VLLYRDHCVYCSQIDIHLFTSTLIANLQIGYFLRMLLLRNRLEESDSFATLAQREMNTLTGAIEHSILPLQDVIKFSDLPRAPGRTPAWQASITWDEEGKV
jgi:hypothetical protein